MRSPTKDTTTTLQRARQVNYEPFLFFLPLFTNVVEGEFCELRLYGVLGRSRDKMPKAFLLHSLLAWFAVERANPLELKREGGAVACTPD